MGDDDKDEVLDKSANKKEVKTFRSFTGEIMDEKKMEELRNKKSLNQRLVNDAELEEEEKYFNYHEKKEAFEEKMINTKEIAAKVVTCKKCKERTYCFDKMPKKACPKCQESSWIRVGMM